MQEERPLPTGAKRAPSHAMPSRVRDASMAYYDITRARRPSPGAIMLAVRGKTHFCNARSRNSEVYFNLLLRSVSAAFISFRKIYSERRA